MPLKIQEEIIEHIKGIGDIFVRRYFGELSVPKKPALPDGELPLVLVDYVGDKPLSVSEVQHTFNLYIAHVSLSKNQDNRKRKHEEVLELIKLVDQALSLKLNTDASLVSLGSLKKIYDAKSDKGYLTVFMRQLHVKQQRAYHLGHNPQNL